MVCTIRVCACVRIVEFYMDVGAGTLRGNIAGFPRVWGQNRKLTYGNDRNGNKYAVNPEIKESVSVLVLL